MLNICDSIIINIITPILVTQKKFEFSEDDVTMSALDAQMRRSFRSWRYRLYEKVKRSNEDQEIAALKPEHVSDEEWMEFFNRMSSEDFKVKVTQTSMSFMHLPCLLSI